MAEFKASREERLSVPAKFRKATHMMVTITTATSMTISAEARLDRLRFIQGSAVRMGMMRTETMIDFAPGLSACSALEKAFKS